MPNLSSSGARSNFGYPKQLRIRKKATYQAIYASGLRYFTAHFIIYLRPTPGDAARHTGMAVSRKIGSAVTRNRLKRLLRECFRLHFDELPKADIVVVAKKQASGKLSLNEIWAELALFFQRKDLLSGTCL